jgi:membrane protein
MRLADHDPATVHRFIAGRHAGVPRRRAPVSRLAPQVERARDVLRFAARRAAEVRLAQVAGSLTFTTVLALVPLLVVALAVFTAFPLFGEFRGALESTLLRNLLPEPFSALILRYLNEFVVKAGRLGALGVVFLVATALLMILTVDRALNDIWRVAQRRRLAQRVLIYWALLTVGPVLIGGSLSLTSWLAPFSTGFVRQLPPAVHAVLDWLPGIVSGFALATTYVLVPNRNVAWHDALIGGFVAAGLGEIVRRGLAAYIAPGSVLTIYGAFAVLPAFLSWIYLSWLMILFGAAIAATLPMLRQTRFADHDRAGNAFVTAAALLTTLLRRRLDNPPGEADTRSLAIAVRSLEEETFGLLEHLESLGYLSRLAPLAGDTPRASSTRWLLTCDPATTTLEPLFRRLAIDPRNSLFSRETAGLGRWLEQALASAWLRQPLARIGAADAPLSPDRPDDRGAAPAIWGAAGPARG